MLGVGEGKVPSVTHYPTPNTQPGGLVMKLWVIVFIIFLCPAAAAAGHGARLRAAPGRADRPSDSFLH